MIGRTKTTVFATFAALACLAGTALAGVVIYENGFASRSDVTELKRVIVPGTGKRCKRQLSAGQMLVTVGRSTTECDYSPPVSTSGGAANLDIGAIITLSPASKLAKKTFLSVGMRLQETGAGAGKYRLDVNPAAQRFALRRYDGNEKAVDATTLAAGKRRYIKKTGKPNKIRLKVFDAAGGAARIVAKINGRLVASVTNPAALQGDRTLISIGRAAGSARGSQGSFDKLVIRTAP